MLIKNSDIRKSMKNTEIYLPDMECSQVIFMEDINTSKKTLEANRTALRDTLPSTRNLPNILRNSNIRAYKNSEIHISDEMDTYFLLDTERTTTSYQLNTTLSSINSEKEVNCSKIASSKLHHQRKQVHNPLNLQCDASDRNSNKDESLMPKVGRVDALRVLSSQEENTSTKKLKCSNKIKKHMYDRKPKKVNVCKTDNETRASNEKSDFDFDVIAISDVNMNNEIIVLQNVDHFFDDDAFIESIYGSNTSSYINGNCTNKNDNDAGSEKLFNIPYYDNEICDFKDMNYNPVVSGGSTEFNVAKHKISQNRFINNESVINIEEELMDEDVESNYLFRPKVLCTCTCMNCTRDKDIIFYEDPNSIRNDNSEAEPYTSYLNDDDYYHIFGDNWLKVSNNENLYCEEIDETNITRENTYIDRNNVAKVIENNANVSMEQNELENVQSYQIDKVQDNSDFKTEFIAHSNRSKRSLKLTQKMKDLDKINCLNVESAVMKKSKTFSTFQKAFAQDAISADVSIPKHKRQKKKSKKQDLCIIQCAQCGKLFNEKHHFRKHFTRCNFYKEDFQCHICDRMYRYKSSLVQHLKKIHNILDGPHEKFYICNKCSKSYIRFRAFQRHMLLHDD